MRASEAGVISLRISRPSYEIGRFTHRDPTRLAVDCRSTAMQRPQPLITQTLLGQRCEIASPPHVTHFTEPSLGERSLGEPSQASQSLNDVAI